eukprot:6206291-Pleurochrysis_carterae.AAC.4
MRGGDQSCRVSAPHLLLRLRRGERRQPASDHLVLCAAALPPPRLRGVRTGRAAVVGQVCELAVFIGGAI